MKTTDTAYTEHDKTLVRRAHTGYRFNGRDISKAIRRSSTFAAAELRLAGSGWFWSAEAADFVYVATQTTDTTPDQATLAAAERYNDARAHGWNHSQALRWMDYARTEREREARERATANYRRRQAAAHRPA